MGAKVGGWINFMIRNGVRNRTWFLGAACAAFAGLALAAGTALSQGDRDFAMSHMHATRKLFLDSVAGLSPAQWNFKPAPDRWSIAEIAEHIALSEDAISQVARKALEGPAEPEKAVRNNANHESDQKLLDAVVDRSTKHTAPETLQPKHKFATPQDAVEHFRAARDANIRFIETTQDDLRAHFAADPGVGSLDAYQWFLMMSAHTQRHTAQINEVKADPKFPKS
jgi:hypothetical protein